MAIRLTASNAEALFFDSALPRTAFTIMLWYYPITLTAGTWYNIFYMENNLGSTAVQTYGTTLYGWGDTNNSTISTNTWVHITMVNDPANNNTLIYKNGVLDITEVRSINGENWVYRQLGRWGESADYMDGRVAGIKIWSAKLSADEINAEMHTLRPQRFENIFSWHPTFYGDTERFSDWSGLAHPLTDVNTVTDEEPPPVSFGASIYRTTILESVDVVGTLAASFASLIATGEGSVTTPSVSFLQEAFRFRADDGSESGASWLANQDTNVAIDLQEAFRLRFLIDLGGSGSSSEQFQVEYRKRLIESPELWGDWKKISSA